ncbi:MAG: hypothetical protein KUG78_07965, partial [Kangiellaceae bacterium]|nr:hypothetical protein [Kangiellaceae bacterium]
KMKVWDFKRYSVIVPSLKNMLDKTNHEIAEASSQSQRTSKDVVLQTQWMKKASELAGAGSDEQNMYDSRLAKNIEMLTTQGVEAYKKRMFNMALTSANKGLQIDPGNLQFESMVSQSEAALFEQNFRGALENGKPESAYSALQEIADKPLMLQVKKKMKNSIILLANYFANNAQAAYRKDDLLLAYSEFKRGRDIQEKLAISNKGFIQEKEFLDLIMAKANSLKTSSGVVFGLLSIVSEFDPGYPQLDKSKASEIERLKNRATAKLSVTEFKEVLSSNSVVASVGRRVASKLERILFASLGTQLQIVADLSALPNPNEYSGAYLSVEGEVLQAAIETSTNKGQRSQSVLIDIKRTETEEYTKWNKRKRGDAPTQFHEQKIMEDVLIQVEHIQKLAVTEVAYRIIEPTSQKLLLTNNVVKEEKYSGDSINEFQKGMFHQKYIAADLPSDIKIIDSLASELSVSVGESLKKYLAQPELKYFSRYEQAVKSGENNKAIELISNAVIISSEESKERASWLKLLKGHVLSL